MPIEGIQTTETNSQPAATPPATPDEAAKNTAADSNDGATATDAGSTNQAEPKTTERTFTQAEVNAMFAQRLPKAVKAELKKMAGENEGGVTVEELQRELSEANAKIRSYDAREVVQDFLADGRNKLNVRPENVRGIQELVIPRLTYDDQGKPENLREAIDAAKAIAPTLFNLGGASNINAGAGKDGQLAPTNMNDLIRRQAGVG